MFRRDPSAPRLAPFLLALLLGFGSATVPAWSLDLGNLVREAPRVWAQEVADFLRFWADDGATTASPDLPGIEAANDGTGGTGDAGVIIDPNGLPKP